MTALAGKVALVTGGSRGIGAAIALRLARDGADVAVTYVSKPESAASVVSQIEAAGRRGLAVAADSADAQAVMDAVDRAAGEFGRLDILVTNAGIFELSPVGETALAGIDRMLAVNVRAVVAATVAAAKHMGEGGRIITIGSVIAERVPMQGASLYALSKAAVAGYMQGITRELGARNITVNTIQPGPIETDMNPATGDFADFQRGLLAINQYGQPEDIAAAVAYLAGPDGRFVTGTRLTVDGGFLA